MEQLNELRVKKDISFQQILNNLLDKQDLELKTHILKPKELTSLKIIAEYLKLCELEFSYNILDKYISFYLEYMVSYKRLSRNEIVKAISNIAQESDDISTLRKLTTNMK